MPPSENFSGNTITPGEALQFGFTRRYSVMLLAIIPLAFSAECSAR